MTENAQISNNRPDDEIRFIDILGFLVLNKNLIFSIISFFTLASVIYCFSATPFYKATISFMPTQELHILDPIIKKRLSEIRQPIFKQFIDQMISPGLQKKVATEGGFLEKFKDGPNDTSNIAQLISRINKSITTSPIHWKANLSLMSPTTVAMTGKDPKVISEFLNALSKAGIKTAQNKTFKLIQETIFKANQDLEFNINLIEQEIKILSKQAKAIRLRKIQILEDYLKVAAKFTPKKQHVGGVEVFQDFVFSNGEKKNRALIKILRKRTNDGLFSPRIIELQALLEAYKNNQIIGIPSGRATYGLPLKSLIGKRNLKKDAEVVIISKKNFFPQEPTTPEKIKIITCTTIVGLFLGIFIAILRNGLRILKKTKTLGSP
jgi:LPS O-antigen subunit length determinant protein (WzzB/FepE family)